MTNAAAKTAAIKTTRRQVGEGYPRNGNAHRPPARFTWTVTVDGKDEGVFFSAKAAREFVTALRDGSLA